MLFVCLRSAQWVVNCSQVQSERQEGESGEWETALRGAKHSGEYSVLWHRCLEDKLAPVWEPAESAFHVAFSRGVGGLEVTEKAVCSSVVC